jgi:ABC-type multidrug transport system fused ATPase/permease subunit
LLIIPLYITYKRYSKTLSSFSPPSGINLLRRNKMSTIQTQGSSIVGSQVERVEGKRLWLAGLGAMVAAVIVNSLIRIIALAALPIPAGNIQLTTPTFVIAFTILGILVATAVFALINRFARRPIPTFRITATVVLFITFIAAFATLAMPHTNIASVLTLVVMHTAAYLFCVGLLTRVAPAK